jgi:quinol monooxygenase YgiN
MTVPIRNLVGTAILAAVTMTEARAQAPVPDGPRYAIAYLEVMPTGATEGATVAREMRDAMRRDAGNMRGEALQRIGRPNQFVILSAWKDQASLDAHAKAAPTAQLDDKLKRIENAPADERVTFPLSVGPLPASLGTDAVLVVTHVDVIPPQREMTNALLKQHAEDGRQEPGNLRFEALTQTNRQNHFTVIEAWASRDAAQAHGMNAATRAFREKVAPAIGALYDERLYKALD